MLVRAIERAPDTAAAAVQDVSVDHRRGHVSVAEELLDGADVVACLQEVGGEGVPLMPGPALPALCRVPDYAGLKASSYVLLGISA